MLLRHIHFPGLTKYSHAIALQSKLVDLAIEHQKALLTPTPLPNTTTSIINIDNPPPSPPVLDPTLITFQSHPTYTSGRRETNRLSPAQVAHLKHNGLAEFHQAPRGGLTTFHGPGQLTAFLICSLEQHYLRPRAYVHRLETIIIDVCKHYDVLAFRTENPGVWDASGEKLASIGVHIRRGVSSYGVGLNVSVDLRWFERIVACGLVGKKVTSLEKARDNGEVKEKEDGPLEVDDVAAQFAKFTALRLEGGEDPLDMGNEGMQNVTVETVLLDGNSELDDREIFNIAIEIDEAFKQRNREKPPP